MLSMKVSIVITVLVFIVAVAIGLQQQARLTEARVERKVLMAEAKLLGVDFEVDGSVAGFATKKSVRKDKFEEARVVAKELVTIALEMEEMTEQGETPGTEEQMQMMEVFERVLAMDVEQIKFLLAEFEANQEMEKETRDGMMVFAVMTLAKDHPEAALGIFSENEVMQENAMVSSLLLSSTLSGWATEDPEAALAWVRENAEEQGEQIGDEVKVSLVRGVGQTSLSAGFDLLEELDLEDSTEGLNALAQNASTGELRREFLELVRAGNFGEDSQNGLSGLADGVFSEGYEKATAWIADAKLSGDELEELTGSMSYRVKESESGKWALWAGENLEGEVRERVVAGIVKKFTENNYPAAGEWLLGVPEGETKEIAVEAYVGAIAEYDPGTATEWAMTLPEGEGRSSALGKVHEKMPEGNEEEVAAKEAYEKVHGLE